MSVRYVFIRRKHFREPGALYAHSIVEVAPSADRAAWPKFEYYYDGQRADGVTVWICYEDGTQWPPGYVGRSGSGSSDMCDILPLVEI